VESGRKHSRRKGVQKVKELPKSREPEEIWTVGFGSRTKESAQEKIISQASRSGVRTDLDHRSRGGYVVADPRVCENELRKNYKEKGRKLHEVTKGGEDLDH
jgi:hypothetical protein